MVIHRLEQISVHLYRDHKTALQCAKYLGIVMAFSGFSYLAFAPTQFSTVHPLSKRIAKGASAGGSLLTLTSMTIGRWGNAASQKTPDHQEKDNSTGSSKRKTLYPEEVPVTFCLTPFKAKITIRGTTTNYSNKQKFTDKENITIKGQILEIPTKDIYFQIDLLAEEAKRKTNELSFCLTNGTYLLPSTLYEQARVGNTLRFEINNMPCEFTLTS